MSDVSDEFTVDINGVNNSPEASVGEKWGRAGKLRSIAWEHFRKLKQEDGTLKSQCIHCHKLFTCTDRSGTTHLLRHIDGTCPVYNNKGKNGRSAVALSSRRGNTVPRSGRVLNLNQVKGHPGQQNALQNEVLPVGFDDLEPQVTDDQADEYGGRSSMPLRVKHPHQPAVKFQPRRESLMNESHTRMGRQADLTSETTPGGVTVQPCSAVAAPDYSIAAALRCLNEMTDIPQSSEMYLDAFELLKDAGERECFICLPPQPRRRWLQRMLHRQYPLRYDCDF